MRLALTLLVYGIASNSSLLPAPCPCLAHAYALAAATGTTETFSATSLHEVREHRRLHESKVLFTCISSRGIQCKFAQLQHRRCHDSNCCCDGGQPLQLIPMYCMRTFVPDGSRRHASDGHRVCWAVAISISMCAMISLRPLQQPRARARDQ